MAAIENPPTVQQIPQTPIEDVSKSFDALNQLKREVKQIMEEAVMKKYIHEEGSTVTSLCASVEACLIHGIRKRVFGLFGTTSTFALLHKISCVCPPAASVYRMVIEIQQKYLKDQKSIYADKSPNSGRLPPSFRYFWIRLALFEKLLSSIVDFIYKNANKFYEKNALMADSIAGSMVSALLVGPCALEYSKMKTLDHYWSDPPADELMQRHRIQSRASLRRHPTSPKTPLPTLNVKRTESLGADDLGHKVNNSALEFVMSLHQNTKSTLLYGKNNVSVFTDGFKDCATCGYLSLHQNYRGSLIVKWTPNDLMQSNNGGENNNTIDYAEKSILWKNALCLDINDIVYLHCHQHGGSTNDGGSVVFVAADGIQYPRIQFPVGQHLLSFLSCLETGLLPWGQLDPPLWSQRGKGKVFPKLPKQTTASRVGSNGSDSSEGEASLDYVFRILPIVHPSTINENVPVKRLTFTRSNGVAPNRSVSLFGEADQQKPKLISLTSFSSRLKQRFWSSSSSPERTPPETPHSNENNARSASITSTEPTSPSGEFFFDAKTDLGEVNEPTTSENLSPALFSSPSRKTLKSACDSMRHQILSRAFYGWLAHCRHLKTIRTHLACLVNRRIIHDNSPVDVKGGLTSERWRELREKANKESLDELYRFVYFGGVEPNLRPEVWPYLLGFYSWHAEEENDNNEHKMLALRVKYEGLLTEWLSVEAIVRERDKEAFLSARISHRSYGEITATPLHDNSLSNDVFFAESDEDEEDSSICSRRTSGMMAKVDHEKVSRNESGFVSQDGMPLTTEVTMEPLELPKSLSLSKMCDSMLSDVKTPEEGDGGIFSKELVDVFALNLHRVERDVHRCDRNYAYFTNKNLDKLKNIMCTYVWEHLDEGYVQGMCDLAAPLLVVTDDEVLTYGCFVILMKRMSPNFAHGGGMDINLANMRSLLQSMDPEFFEFMHKNGDYTHFYFCYRWFLLDFKREFIYEDVFFVWETIWAGLRVASSNFALFLALALMETYREVIIDNNMDFTDIIKFFNEMAEKHDSKVVIQLARDLVHRLQVAIENDP